MKKLLFMGLIFSALTSTTTHAQAGDPPSILQQMKDKQKPGLVEKVGLTEAQAEKVIEINYEIRQQAGSSLRDLNEADRAKKIAEFKATKEKRYSEIPLTPEQIKAVYSYYEDMGRNMQKKAGS